jgi:hypothetical protein
MRPHTAVIRVYDSTGNLINSLDARLLGIAAVLVRLDHVARVIVTADHGVMRERYNACDTSLGGGENSTGLLYLLLALRFIRLRGP